MSTQTTGIDAQREELFKQDFNRLAEEHGVDKAVDELNRLIKLEKQLVDISYEIKAFRNEGAYAISLAVEEVLGRFDMNTKEGASNDRPPELIHIELPDGTNIKIPWGEIALPSFTSDCYIDLDYDYEETTVLISARICKKDEEQIRRVVDKAKEILAEKSIYMAQAIELEFDDDGSAKEPNYMDLTAIDENKILFSKEINDGLVPILARIKNTKACVEQGLDIKLGVLMEGPYGTGKTLTAFWLGKIAREYGWTFIYLKNCKNSAKALKIAENYARNGNGVILFTEDIDQVLRGERGQEIQDIVNTLDGGDTKNLPIISIFTTNHIEVIEPTFLRGKRIGSLIQFGVLDMDTASQFINKLVIDKNGKSLMEKGDHTTAVESLCGLVPAFASEVIDKAKAYMINRNATKISNDDIISAAVSYKKQIEFAQCKLIEAKSTSDMILSGFGEVVAKALFNGKDKPNNQVQRLIERIHFEYNS